MLKHSGSGGLTTAGASNEQDYPDYTEVIYKWKSVELHEMETAFLINMKIMFRRSDFTLHRLGTAGDIQILFQIDLHEDCKIQAEWKTLAAVNKTALFGSHVLTLWKITL